MNLPLSFLPLEPELIFLGVGSLRSIMGVDSVLVCVRVGYLEKRREFLGNVEGDLGVEGLFILVS